MRASAKLIEKILLQVLRKKKIHTLFTILAALEEAKMLLEFLIIVLKTIS